MSENNYNQLPCNIQAIYNSDYEQAVLSAMKRDPESLNYVRSIGIKSGDFYSPDHALLFDLIIEIENAGVNPEPSIIKDFLDRHGLSNRGKDLLFLATNIFSTPGTSANIDFFCTKLQELSAKRKIEGIFQKNVLNINNLPLSEIQILGESIATLSNVNESVKKVWEPVLPFDGAGLDYLTADLFPTWIGDYVKAVSDTTQTDEGMAGMAALSVIATSVQGNFSVSPSTEYTEPLPIWTVSISPPATRKTAVLNSMIEPLVMFEKSENLRIRDDIERTETTRNITLERIKKLQSDAAKEKDSCVRDGLINEIENLRLEMPDEVIAPRLFTGDTTPERLQSLMAEQKGNMTVLSDEGGIFDIMAGLYSDKVNLDIFLKGHAGSPIRVDRVGREPVIIDRPALSFGLMIQPSILSDFSNGSKKRFRGTGTLARFLFYFPRTNIGMRDVRKQTCIPERVRNTYRTNIQRLLSIPHDPSDTPVELPLSPIALEQYFAFAEMIEKRIAPGKDLDPIADWAGKLPGAALRIAGLFHLAETHGSSTAINSMERALDLCNCLISHAKAAFSHIGTTQAEADATVCLEWINRKGEKCFRRNEIHRDLHGRFSSVERLISALSELTSRNYISEPIKQPTGKRPSISHEVNPVLLAEI